MSLYDEHSVPQNAAFCAKIVKFQTSGHGPENLCLCIKPSSLLSPKMAVFRHGRYYRRFLCCIFGAVVAIIYYLCYDSREREGSGMELACTKKVLDYLGIKAEKVSADIDPLFGWTANLIMINRRKTLVAVHTASRAVFVLHG